MKRKLLVFAEKNVVVQMDTTYWGRNFGLMLFKDALRNRVLLHKFVKHETIKDYLEGVTWLEEHGFRIWGIVCDGMVGLVHQLSRYPVQMCQFHQMLIVRRYLTQTPELEASKALLDLANQITKMDKDSFAGTLDEWCERYENILNERTTDLNKKTPPYMRPRLRSAYRSIRRNMKWQWTFYDNPNLGLPNTNNGIEGIFSDIKTKIRVHSGLTKEHRMRFIDEYLFRHYYSKKQR